MKLLKRSQCQFSASPLTGPVVDLILIDNEDGSCNVMGTDADKNVSDLTGTLSAVSSDANILVVTELQVDKDAPKDKQQLKFVMHPVGPLGEAVVTITAEGMTFDANVSVKSGSRTVIVSPIVTVDSVAQKTDKKQVATPPKHQIVTPPKQQDKK